MNRKPVYAHWSKAKRKAALAAWRRTAPYSHWSPAKRAAALEAQLRRLVGS